LDKLSVVMVAFFALTILSERLTSGPRQGTRDKFHCPLQIGVGRGGGAG